MNDYGRLQTQLARVRRRWKRTQALSGLAIVLVEAIGVFVLLLMVNGIYRPEVHVRLPASLAGLVFLAAMFVRHVVAPLLRRIPDDQLALYVEEHNDRYEGALMTAAEFGANPALAPAQSAMIRAVVAEAALRAERADPRRAVALARLRKYGLGAVLLSAASAAAMLAFRDEIAEPAQHVLTPWRITESELRRDLPPEIAAPQPIVVTLSRSTPLLRPDNTLRLPRGGSAELEVTLSRSAEGPVELCYRSAGAGPKAKFQRLEMVKIERLNSYGVKLADVDGDVEVFAAAEGSESPRYQINVYDPIAVSGFEVAVKYPEYLKLPDRSETQPNGDVTAPIGSAAAVRIVTNRPLRAGKIAWDDGREEPLALDKDKETNGLVSIPIAADRSYTFTLEDVDGQHYASPSPSMIHALKDEPPTVAVRSPSPNLLVHPVGGVTFTVDASDDFGLEGVDLVYMPQTDDSAREIRVPLALPKPAEPPTAGRLPIECRLRLAMEELQPRPQPGATISYYLEARDRNPKNGLTVTDLGFLYIRPYETWASFSLPEPPEEPQPTEKSLEELVRAVWNLHRRKDDLPPDEFRKQALDWAKWMEDESGAVLKLVVLPPGMALTPVKQTHLDKGNEYVAQAHEALGKADTAEAARYLRLAMGEQAMVGFQDELLAQMTQAPTATEPSDQHDATSAAAQMLRRMEAEMQIEPPEKKAVKNDQSAAEAAKKETARIKQDQKTVIQKAETKAPPPPPKPEEAGAEGQPETPPPPPPAQLAADETALANRTKATAETLRRESVDPKLGEVANKLDDAARKMTQAAEQFKSNRVEEAVATSKEAHMELAAAETQLDAVQQGDVDNALAELEARAQRVLQHQRDLRAKVEDTAKKLPDGEKPTTQQERDLKAQVAGQVRVKVEADQLAEGLARLAETAPESAGRETLKFIAEANRNMKRGRPDQKMSNAVVELTMNKPAAAAQEQKSAESALEKVAASLAAAEGTLASDWKSEARRAKREAEAVEKSVARLDPKGEAAQPSPEARQEAAEQAAIDASRLARHVQARDMAEKPDADALAKTAADAAGLARRLQEDEKAREELTALARRINNKIEAEIQARIDAEKLLSAQREQCPPQYRELVNKYYEALSHAKK